MTCFYCGYRLTWSLARWLTLIRFFATGRKSVRFCVSIETDLVLCGWSKLTWFLCGGWNLTGFRCSDETNWLLCSWSVCLLDTFYNPKQQEASSGQTKQCQPLSEKEPKRRTRFKGKCFCCGLLTICSLIVPKQQISHAISAVSPATCLPFTLAQLKLALWSSSSSRISSSSPCTWWPL